MVTSTNQSNNDLIKDKSNHVVKTELNETQNCLKAALGFSL